MNLPVQLAQLEQAEIVRRMDEPDLAYFFKHALTQETAYASLLKRNRREIHAQVAEAIEAQNADSLDEFAALLAQHYAAAENDAKTLEYSAQAGDCAARIYANAEAIAHYSKAIDAAKRIGAPATELYLKRGREYELASQFPAALANYDEMEQLAHIRSDRKLELGALLAQCLIRCTPTSEFNPGVGEPLTDKALALARELVDREAEAKLLWILINLYRFTDRMAQAREAGEASLKIARQLNLREQMGYTLNDLTHAYAGEDFRHGQELIREATRTWRELGNMPMLADSLSTFSLYGSSLGDLDDVISFSNEALQISQSIGNLWGQTYSLSTVGIVHWLRGDIGLGIGTMEESLRLSAISGYPVPQLMTRSDLGVAYASMGAYAVGLEHARGALEFADKHMPALRPYAVSGLVQIHLWLGDHASAVEILDTLAIAADNSFLVMQATLSRMRLAVTQGDYERALHASEVMLQYIGKLDLRTYHPEALYYKGQAEHALGQLDAARESLLQARVSAKALRARWLLWQILGALGENEMARGDKIAVDNFLAEARSVIDYIAEHAPSALRGSFLNLASVKKLEESYVGKWSEH